MLGKPQWNLRRRTREGMLEESWATLGKWSGDLGGTSGESQSIFRGTLGKPLKKLLWHLGGTLGQNLGVPSLADCQVNLRRTSQNFMGTLGNLGQPWCNLSGTFVKSQGKDLGNVRATSEEPQGKYKILITPFGDHQWIIRGMSEELFCVFRDLFSTMLTSVIPEFCVFERTSSG